MRKLASCVVLLVSATSINSAIAGNIGIGISGGADMSASPGVSGAGANAEAGVAMRAAGSNSGAEGRSGAAAGMESDVQIASNASLSDSSLSAALLIGVDFSADAGLF